MARLRTRLPLVVAVILGFLAAAIPLEAARLIRSPSVIPGTLTALGDAHIAGNLHVTGTTAFRTVTRIGSAGTEGNYTLHLGGTLRVSGASTLTGAVTLTDASALHVGGALHVTGTTSFRTITRIGAAGTEGNYTLHVGGTLRSGAATISGAVSITDTYALHVAGNLHVEGTTSFRNFTRMGSAGTDGAYTLHVGGTLRVQGASTLTGNLTLTDGSTLFVSDVIDFAGGDITLTRSPNTLTIAGGDLTLQANGSLSTTSGYLLLNPATTIRANATIDVGPNQLVGGSALGTNDVGLARVAVGTWRITDSGAASYGSLGIRGMTIGSDPIDGATRAHLAAVVHAETSLSIGAHVVTVANNTVGASANTEILSGLRSLYFVDCNDPDGCTIQLGTAGLSAGALTKIISITTNAATLSVSDVAAVQHVAGAFTMGVADAISLVFTRNRSGAVSWIETGRSDN